MFNLVGQCLRVVYFSYDGGKHRYCRDDRCQDTAKGINQKQYNRRSEVRQCIRAIYFGIVISHPPKKNLQSDIITWLLHSQTAARRRKQRGQISWIIVKDPRALAQELTLIFSSSSIS